MAKPTRKEILNRSIHLARWSAQYLTDRDHAQIDCDYERMRMFDRSSAQLSTEAAVMLVAAIFAEE